MSESIAYVPPQGVRYAKPIPVSLPIEMANEINKLCTARKVKRSVLLREIFRLGFPAVKKKWEDGSGAESS